MTVDSINFYVVNPLELTISKDKPIAIFSTQRLAQVQRLNRTQRHHSAVE